MGKKEKPKKREKKAPAEDADEEAPERPKRDRKKVEQFQTDGAPDGGSRAAEDYTGGSGSKLGDIHNVNTMITKEKEATMIQLLHRLCYKSAGKKTTQKKKLREFSGVNDTKDATRDRVSRVTVSNLRKVARLFDCSPDGSERDDFIDAVTKFLLNPKASGKPLTVERKKGTKRKASSKKSSKKATGRKKKDPNAPKKALSAYFFFANEQRPNVQKKHPTYSITEVAKKLGSKWGALSESEKKPYNKMAEKDKQRYQKEMAAYNKKGGSSSRKTKQDKKKQKKKAAESSDDSDDSDDDESDDSDSEEEASPKKGTKRQREETDDDKEEESDEKDAKKQKDE